jgi:hypothetical protein
MRRGQAIRNKRVQIALTAAIPLDGYAGTASCQDIFDIAKPVNESDFNASGFRARCHSLCHRHCREGSSGPLVNRAVTADDLNSRRKIARNSPDSADADFALS